MDPTRSLKDDPSLRREALARAHEDRATRVKLGQLAHLLLGEKRYAEAIEIFDVILGYDDLPLVHYCNALWVAQADNTGLPPDPARLHRWLAQAAARGVVGFEHARHQLRLRLIPERQVATPRTRYVSRELARGLHVALALDTPDQVVFVHPRDLERWERPVDELFDLASRNTAAEPLLETFDLRTSATSGIVALMGDSYYAASHVLFLERYLPTPRDGQLVAIPDRHGLFVLPLDGMPSADAVGTLIGLCRDRFQTAPGPICDQLYWRGGPGSLVQIDLGVRS